jgi:hypothetical protein
LKRQIFFLAGFELGSTFKRSNNKNILLNQSNYDFFNYFLFIFGKEKPECETGSRFPGKSLDWDPRQTRTLGYLEAEKSEEWAGGDYALEQAAQWRVDGEGGVHAHQA